MEKKIVFVNSHDSWDCETCGGSFTSSFCIEQGDKVFGEYANAYCFDSTYTSIEQALESFCEANVISFVNLKEACTIRNEEDDEWEWEEICIHKVKKFLEDLGFEIEDREDYSGDDYEDDDYED